MAQFGKVNWLLILKWYQIWFNLHFSFRLDVQFNVVATNAVGASPPGPSSPVYSVIGKKKTKRKKKKYLTCIDNHRWKGEKIPKN